MIFTGADFVSVQWGRWLFIDWLGLSLSISDRHADGYMLAVPDWRHDKYEHCSDKPLAANSRNYAAKKANNRCDKRSTPGNPHRQHCNWATAFRGRVPAALRTLDKRAQL